MWLRIGKFLMILGALLLGACAEPLFIPVFSPFHSPQNMQAFQDGGYCQDTWGRNLDNLTCTQQYIDLYGDYYKSKK